MPRMKYLITGGSGGLGKAVKQYLYDTNVDNFGAEAEVITLGRDGCDINLDLADTTSIELRGHLSNVVVDYVIHCAGANYIAPHLRLEETSHIIRLLNINAISQFRINTIMLDRKLRPNAICHVISDAAWTPMTHSLAYNVSKAAQLMVMRQMAHETKASIIFGVSPGKIASTGMSDYIDNTFPDMRGMTFKQGRDYQLSRLRTGEMPPETVAEFIVNLVSTANKHMHGQNYVIGG